MIPDEDDGPPLDPEAVLVRIEHDKMAIQVLARHVENLDHFNAILAGCDPAMRAEVRAMLAPLMPFPVPAEDVL